MDSLFKFEVPLKHSNLQGEPNLQGSRKLQNFQHTIMTMISLKFHCSFPPSFLFFCSYCFYCSKNYSYWYCSNDEEMTIKGRTSAPTPLFLLTNQEQWQWWWHLLLPLSVVVHTQVIEREKMKKKERGGRGR